MTYGRGGMVQTRLDEFASLPETQLDALMLDPDGPSVVAIGGGHGLAAALEAIQLYAGRVTAVVSVADDGGSSGRLTGTMGIPAPGDIRRCLLALTPEPSLMSELFAHRFQSGDVSDHSLGNLMLAALTELFGDFGAAVETAGRLLGTVGQVVPATKTPVGLKAVLDGETVSGQVNIALHRGTKQSLQLDPPDPEPNLRALEAIAGADQIVLGPGSLFTSVIAALLVPEVAAAVMHSPAQRVWVANLVTQDGETWDMDGAAHVDALAEYGGIEGPGTILVHDGELVVPPGHKRITFEDDHLGSWKVRRADVADHTADWPAHDSFTLARALEGSLA